MEYFAGIIGSANINERSMWHDSEVALGFRASAEGSKSREMLETLCTQHFGMEPPEGEEAFKGFCKELAQNAKIYNKGKPSGPLDMHALPLIMRDEAMASAPSAG